MLYRVAARGSWCGFKVRPSKPIPPMDSVAQIGSPEKVGRIRAYAGNEPTRFITKWSINSCAWVSVITPFSGRVRCRYTNEDTRPKTAAPFEI